MFGSGVAYGIYAQFIQQAGVQNNGKRIGILRGAGTRFATYFYAMMRLVHFRLLFLQPFTKSYFLISI